MIKKWQKGDDLVLDLRCKDALNGNALYDPTTVTFEAKPAGGESLLFRWPSEIGYDELTRLEAGKFRVVAPLETAGTWYRQWRAEGPDFNDSTPWVKFVVEDDPA